MIDIMLQLQGFETTRFRKLLFGRANCRIYFILQTISIAIIIARWLRELVFVYANYKTDYCLYFHRNHSWTQDAQ